MRRGPAAASMARAAASPATPAPPAAAAGTRGWLARLDAPRLAPPAFEPGLGIAKEAREHLGIAAAGGRDDFEYGARLVEVWTMDKPARAARRRNQMR
jgi:hypothetical protein